MNDASNDAPSSLPPRIVLYDGVCGLCHRSVAWLLAHDTGRTLWFAQLQGETAAALRRLHPEIPETLETVVFVSDGRAHLRSKAFVHAAASLPWPWRAASLFTWLPAPLLDWAYNLVASVRYRVWGKYDVCRVPDTAERERLLP